MPTLQTPALLLLDAVLIFGLLHAVFTDLRTRRISNRLTYPAMVAGLVIHSLLGGWDGFSHSALGWGVGLGVMLLPFILGAMGAGDVKLMAAIGALKGPEFVAVVALYACLAGGILAAFYLMRERRLSETLKFIAYGWFWALQGKAPKAGSIPYAPAIAAGVVIALLPYSLISLF